MGGRTQLRGTKSHEGNESRGHGCILPFELQGSWCVAHGTTSWSNSSINIHQVSKEAYPDYTAWDLKHPYYDAKTDKENPKWYMVDLTFVERAKNFIPLALLRYIGDIPSTTPPPELEYVGEDGISAIKGMDLVTRGRLSVQRVSEEAWNTIQLLAKRGGWEGLNLKSPQKKATKAMVENKRKGKTTQRKDVDEQHVAEEVASDAAETSPPRAPGRKRKREAANIDPEAVEGDSEARPLRRSGRFRK
ncbi:hypothetical protein PTI98_005338 [Pleurotus ostreatus]|nr:hypothetical protein PTI98_005338 [Pleurotus ostreatus]